jgi:hypothetical protein
MFNEKDFDALKYPIHKKEPSRIPELMAIEGMSALKEREIAYIIYRYDKNSPLQKITDFQKRSEFAAERSGYDVDKDDLEYLYLLKTPELRQAIIGFLKHQHDMQFAALITFEHRFFENLTHLMTPLDQEDINLTLRGAELKGKLEKSTNDLIESIMDMRSKVYGDDSQLAQITESFTPELISQKMKRK